MIAHRTQIVGAALLGLSTLSACAVVHMDPPGSVGSATERVALTGIGGWYKGDFRLAGYTGKFHRNSRKGGFIETVPERGYVNQLGDLTFNIAGADLAGELSANCNYRQVDYKDGDLSYRVDQLHYRCDFKRNGVALDAHLKLDGRVDARTEPRTGEMYWRGRRIQIRSTHTAKRLRTPTTLPLGYVFSDGTREIGGVDVNGSPKIAYLPADGDDREIAAVMSVALALLWDPGDD